MARKEFHTSITLTSTHKRGPSLRALAEFGDRCLHVSATNTLGSGSIVHKIAGAAQGPKYFAVLIPINLLLLAR